MVANRKSLINTLDPPIACAAENQNFISDIRKPGECFYLCHMIKSRVSVVSCVR